MAPPSNPSDSEKGVGGLETLPAADAEKEDPASPGLDYGDTLASPGAGPGAPGAVTAETEGRYLIRRELAAGGQSRVYVAYDTHLRREVAFKQPRVAAERTGSESGEVLSRFLREARITARLEHPNIVPIHEIGERQDGSFYCVQKLIGSGEERGPSRPLRRALREAGSAEERLRLLPHFLDVCHAIAHAHEQGVIHRDIKPDNVVIGRLGETVVLDWGLAKVIGESDEEPGALGAPAPGSPLGEIDAADGETQAGFALGTPSYMSPEQAAGDVGAIDERSDIFSLGALLHEILTGEPPFVGDSAIEILERAASEPVPPIRTRHWDVPRALGAVADKALARAPEERYQRAADLADDIAAYESGLRVGVYRYSPWELLGLFVARHRMISAITLLGVLLLALSGGVAWWNYQRAGSYLGDARENLAFAFVEKARVAQERLQWDRAAAYYAAARAQADLPEARWGAMLTRNRQWRERARLQEHAGNVGVLRFSPDGRLVATAGADGTVTLFDLQDGRERDHLRTDDILSDLSFAPDGGSLAIGGEDGRLRLWSVETGEDTGLLRHDEAIHAVAFSPGGARIALGTADSWLKVYDIAEDRLVFERKFEENAIFGAQYTPDGEALVIAGWDGSARFLDPDSGELIQAIEAHRGSFSMAISPGGDFLATGGKDRLVKLWRIDDGTLLHRLEEHTQRVYAVAFSPDGRTLASGSTDKTVRLWDVESGGLLVGESYAADDPVRTLAFSPSGDSLAWAGGREVWLRRLGEIPERSEVPIVTLAVSPDGALLGHAFDDRLQVGDAAREKVQDLSPAMPKAMASQGRFSPDGSEFYAICGYRKVCAWEVSTQKLLWTVKAPSRPTAIALSPDESFLAVGTESGGITIWDPSTQELARELATAHESRLYSLDFSPNGKTLASGSFDTDVILWKTASWEERTRLVGHSHAVHRVRFSPDGSRIATASGDLTVRLWDPEAGDQLAVLEGHEDFVLDLAFDPRQRFLASGGSDGTLRVWDLEERRELAAFVTDEEAVSGVEVLPDGDGLVYAGRAVHHLDLGGLGPPDEELERVLADTGLALQGIELERRGEGAVR